MQSRMNKYQNVKEKKYERTKKNTKLYEDVYDDIYRDTSYQNMQVLDTAKEINISKLKNIINDKYDTRQYRTMRNYSIDEYVDDRINYDDKKNKIYDINQIISDAKSRRTFIEEAKEKQKYLDYIEENKKEYQDLKNDEKELEELINTMTIPKENIEKKEEVDLFSDLKGSDNTIVTNPIETSFEIEKEILDKPNHNKEANNNADKTFYTDSNMFTKNDFEDFNTLKGELKRNNKLKIAIIVILILAIIVIAIYYVITNFLIK